MKRKYHVINYSAEFIELLFQQKDFLFTVYSENTSVPTHVINRY